MARVLALAAVLFTAAAAVSGQPNPVAGDWSEIVTLDCNGGVHWGNSQQLWRAGADASVAKQFWDFAVGRIQQRFRCHCPTLTDLEVQTHFNGSFAAVLQWFDAAKTNVNGLANCQGNALTAFTTDVSGVGDSFAVNLPNTCSYESWASGAPCLVTMPMPALSGVTFQMAFDHCPLQGGGESNVPYVSVTCSGAACKDFMIPCNNNNDCSSNQQCAPLFTAGDTTSVINWLNTALPKANLWVNGLFPPAAPCESSTGVHISDTSVGAWVLNSLIGVITPYTSMGAASLPITNLQFCNGGTWSVNGGGYNPLIRLLGKGCTKTYNPQSDLYEYDCQLSAWDGTLADGSSVLSAARKAGEPFIPFASPSTGLAAATAAQAAAAGDSEPINLFSFPCGDGSDAPNDQLGVLLNSPGVAIKAALPVVHAVQSAVAGLAATMADCRNGGVPLAPDQFDIRFNPGFAPVLNAAVDHTPPHPFLPPESALADPYTAAYKALDPFTPQAAWPNPIVHLPDTCSLNSWLTTGSCGVAYSGLSSLLSRDVTIRFGAYQCPAMPHTFGLHAECVGAGCRDVVQPYVTSYCRQDSDCPSGRTCQQVPNLGAGFIGDAFWNVFGSGVTAYVNLEPPQSNQTFFANMNAAQQQAALQQLYRDVVNATNMAAAYYNYYPWTPITYALVDQQNTQVYWGMYPSITIYFFPGPNNPNYFSSYMYNTYQFLQTMPMGQYANYIYPSYQFPQYVKCPNGGWILGNPSQCSPPDTCDTEGALEADLLNFIITATGQAPPNPPIDPTASFHGYCATVFNNITQSNLNAWANTQYSFDATRTNPRVIDLPYVTAWAPPVPPAPQPPSNNNSGLSDSAKAGVVTASVLGGALAIGAVFCCCCRKKRDNNLPLSEQLNPAAAGRT